MYCAECGDEIRDEREEHSIWVGKKRYCSQDCADAEREYLSEQGWEDEKQYQQRRAAEDSVYAPEPYLYYEDMVKRAGPGYYGKDK